MRARSATSPLEVIVANSGNNSVSIYIDGSNCCPEATISGANTLLDSPSGVVQDSQGNLYVSNQRGTLSNTGSITVFAADATGNTAPIRTITGPDTEFIAPQAITLDQAGDIFVASLDNSVYEFAAGAQGNVPPINVIQGPDTGLAWPNGIGLDSLGKVYVANLSGGDGSGSVTIFSAGSTGDTPPHAIIAGSDTGLGSPTALLLSQGSIYVANLTGGGSSLGSITVYPPDASGDAIPTTTIVGSSTSILFPVGLAVDSAGNLFSANAGNLIAEFGSGSSGNTRACRLRCWRWSAPGARLDARSSRPNAATNVSASTNSVRCPATTNTTAAI